MQSKVGCIPLEPNPFSTALTLRRPWARHGRIDLHDVGHSDDACDRVMSRRKLEIEVVVKRRVNRVRRIDQEERAAVRSRIRDRLGCDIIGRARAIFCDERLPKAVG